MSKQTVGTPKVKCRKDVVNSVNSAMVIEEPKEKDVHGTLPHHKLLRKCLYQREWRYFAMDVKPNLGKILTLNMDGSDERWIHMSDSKGKMRAEYFVLHCLINEKLFPEEARRQKQILEEEVTTSSPWMYVRGYSLDDIESYVDTKRAKWLNKVLEEWEEWEISIPSARLDEVIVESGLVLKDWSEQMKIAMMKNSQLRSMSRRLMYIENGRDLLNIRVTLESSIKRIISEST